MQCIAKHGTAGSSSKIERRLMQANGERENMEQRRRGSSKVKALIRKTRLKFERYSTEKRELLRLV